MAVTQVNLGAAGTGAGGDTLRVAIQKINGNFSSAENAASRLVQANSEDTTPTRLLAVGAANILSASASAGFSTLLGSRFLRAGVDGPLGATICGGISIGVTGSIEQQLAGRLGRVFFRSLGDSTGSDWRELFHSRNVLGTVAQSGGVPTGSIIERGSNANGEYVKFADGTLICVRSLSIADLAGTAAYGTTGLHRHLLTWTFPATFISQPYCAGAGVDSGQHGFVGGGTGGSGTGITLAYFTTISAPTAVFGRVIAIGRWF